MLVCAKQKAICSPTGEQPPPPCPPPPRKPFPWYIPIAVTVVSTFFGLLYKYYLYRLKYAADPDNKIQFRPRQKIRRPVHVEDIPACVQYLIVGGGTAGYHAYKAIMENDSTAKVFFITMEDILPYMRPPLSKTMWWNSEPPDPMTLFYVENGRKHSLFYMQCKKFMDPVKFYRRKRGPLVSIASGWCVVRVDPDEHVVWVETNCGEAPVYYEKLLLAPGARTKNLSVFKHAPKDVRRKVTTMRTVRDLEMAYAAVRDAKHVTIIGGGLIGTELAYHIGRMHKEWTTPPSNDYEPPQVAFVFKDKGVLAGILPEYLGEWAAEKVKCENVVMYPQTQVYDAFMTKDAKGEDKLELTLSNGNCIKTDFVIVAVGTEARDDLAEPSELELDRELGGFLVNTELEARRDLFVAGDAASVFSQWKQRRLRTEHYHNAMEQGSIAGANMTGYWHPYNMEPHFWMRLKDDIQMEVVGEVGACMPTVAIFKPCHLDKKLSRMDQKAGELDKPCFKKTEEYRNRYKRGMLFYLRDETVVGIIFWNFLEIEDRFEVAQELLRAMPSYKDINLLAELLGFAGSECVYVDDSGAPIGSNNNKTCIQNSKWQPYDEYERIGALAPVKKIIEDDI